MDILKGRIHCETFLLEHFMTYSLASISWNMKYFHEMLLIEVLKFIAYVSHQQKFMLTEKRF